jgi:hypothetical protein
VDYSFGPKAYGGLECNPMRLNVSLLPLAVLRRAKLMDSHVDTLAYEVYSFKL